MILRRRFLPFFPFVKPLPLLDIEDPRSSRLAATEQYANPYEKFRSSSLLDDAGEPPVRGGKPQYQPV
jgi:hypothetical protein